jgi:hypothetical protein
MARPARKDQKKWCMLRGRSNRRVARKYIEITNHSRAVTYFTEISGISLGMMQTSIQISWAESTMVIGCRQTRGSSTSRSRASFTRKSSMMPTISGSVGRATPMPPRSSCSRLIESGVQKTMKSRSRSSAVTIAHTISSTAGSRFSQ